MSALDVYQMTFKVLGVNYVLYIKAGLFTFTHPYLFYLKTTHYK